METATIQILDDSRIYIYMYPCTNYLISEYVSVVSQDLYGLGLGYTVYSPKGPFFHNSTLGHILNWPGA